MQQQREAQQGSLAVAVQSQGVGPIPKNAKEALSPEFEANWCPPMKEEMASMKEYDVWELVPPRLDMNIVGSRWVFVSKYRADGTTERRKARLVAQGFGHHPGIDLDEVYASVVSKTTIRTLFHLAATRGLLKHIHQMDAKTAYLYLYNELLEDVYMKQPEGFVNPEHPDWECHLKRSLYGLKQSAR